MAGVSLFYVLSGFVMAWVYRPDDTALQFYRRRFARIYPAYFVAVTVAICVSLVTRDFTPSELAAYTLLQAWSPAEAIHYAANPVFWSLSCEAFFYLVFPVIAGTMSRASSRRLWTLAIGAAAAVIAIGAVASQFWDNETVRWLVYIFPPTRFLEFAFGAALGFLVSRGLGVTIPPTVAIPLALVALLAASYAPSGMRLAAITIIPFALLVVSLAQSDLAGRASGFSAPWLVELGVWSYCFYLIHAMAQGWSVRLGGVAGAPSALSLITSLGFAIVGAWLLHILVERRFERRLRPHVSTPRLDAD